MSQQNTIRCPSCDTEIDVNEILYHQIEGQLKDKLTAEAAKQKKNNDAALAKIKEQQDALSNQEEQFEKRLNESVNEKLTIERQKITEQLKKQITEEQIGRAHV